MTENPIEFNCASSCKTSVTVPADQTPAGWVYLEITKRYRCPQCQRDLDKINTMFKDKL